MKAWGCITANGSILPRTIRASEAEADLMMDAEPLARMVAMLDVRIDEAWAARATRDMLNAQARSMGAAE